MASQHTVFGYVPLRLVSNVLATFATGYSSSDWSGVTTKPSGVDAVDIIEGVLTEITVSDYLTQDSLDDLIPFAGQSTVTPRLEYYNSTTSAWVESNTVANWDNADFEPDPVVGDFTVQSKTGDKNIIEIQIPETISTNIADKYRLRIDIDQDDAD